MKFQTYLLLGGLCSLLCLQSAVQAKTASLSHDPETFEHYTDRSAFQLELSSSNKLFPDNRMMYTVFFENTGYAGSDDIDITSPVPPQTVYVPDSASGQDCDILFSVDGGENWGTPNDLKVQAAGGEWRSADASDYTHIKWVYRPVLRPAEVQQVSFQVRFQ